MSKIQRNTPLSQNTPIGSPLGVGVSSIGGFGGLPPRYIRTFTGTQYGTLNTPQIFTNGGTVVVEFSRTDTATGVASYFVDSDAAGLDRAYVYMLDSTLGFNPAVIASVTIDGNNIANGGSIAAYLDGKIHSLEATLLPATTGNIGTIGSRFSVAEFFKGSIFSVKSTDSGGVTPVVTNYVIDNASTTTTYARGYVSPSAYYITWTNFAPTDIQLATYNPPLRRWESTTTADVWEYV